MSGALKFAATMLATDVHVTVTAVRPDGNRAIVAGMGQRPYWLDLDPAIWAATARAIVPVATPSGTAAR
jgi:hypothetical protein